MALLSLALIALASPARAESGRTAAPVLAFPAAARAIAMGQAFAAVEGGLDSLSYNPAGLARIKRPSLQSTYTHGIIDDRFSFTAYAHPLPFAVLHVGFLYYDAGNVQLKFSNGEQRKVKAQQDMAGLLGASVPFGSLSAGGTLKIFRLDLAETAQATGYAADAGGLWKTPVKGLTLGASLQNAGPDVTFESEGDPLPLGARFGAAYLWDWAYGGDMSQTSAQFRFAADGVKVREEELAAGVGAEMTMAFGPDSRAALRFGYLFNRDLDSFSTGIGWNEKRITFDYAFGAKRSVSHVHHLSVGFLF